MATRADVAKRAGVATGTVSNILNGKKNIAPEIVEKVKKAIDELGYVPNHNAKSLASKTNRHIGIALYEYENSYHWEVVRCIEEYATQRGYFVSIFVLDNNSKYKFDTICERRLSALINFMTNDYPRNFIEILKRQEVNLVNFDTSLGPVFTTDYSDAMTDIMKKLKADGHKRVAYVWSGDELRFNADTRGKVFKKMVKELGFDAENCPVIYNNDPQKLSYDIGYSGGRKLFEQYKDITAVFGTNDLVAIGVMRALKDIGYSVPKDVCVIGCDDTMIAQNYIPSITSMQFDKRLYGQTIAKTIIDKIEGEEAEDKEHFVCAQAVFRESSER